MTYVVILQTETIKRTLYPDYRSNTVLLQVTMYLFKINNKANKCQTIKQ
jgi:hypothetical protein